MYYKLEQADVKNWDRFILLQIGASAFTNKDKLGQLLQIRRILCKLLQITVTITNCGITDADFKYDNMFLKLQ